MTTLLMVMHGQPTGEARGQDALCWRGISQARRIGAWLAGMERPIDVVWCGPHRAQVDTARHMVDAAAEAGRRPPAPVAVEDLADFPARVLSQRRAEGMLERANEARLRPLDPAVWDRPARDATLERWTEGGLAREEVESFAAFQERVRRGLEALTARTHAGQCVAVVTSAAVVATAVQIALGLPALQFARLERAVAHGAVTELALSEEGAELIAFNTIGHLAREERTEPSHPVTQVSAAFGACSASPG